MLNYCCIDFAFIIKHKHKVTFFFGFFLFCFCVVTNAGVFPTNLNVEVTAYLIREHTNFLQDRADGSTPLSPSSEGNNAVTAHVVTASHDGPAGTQNHQQIQCEDALLQEKADNHLINNIHKSTVPPRRVVDGHDVSIGLL